jgi:hypothetical protein
MSSYSGPKNILANCFDSGLMLVLFFDPEDEGDMLL